MKLCMKSMTGLKISKQDTWWLSGGTTREKYSNLKEIVFNTREKYSNLKEIVVNTREKYSNLKEIVFTT